MLYHKRLKVSVFILMYSTVTGVFFLCFRVVHIQQTALGWLVRKACGAANRQGIGSSACVTSLNVLKRLFRRKEFASTACAHRSWARSRPFKATMRHSSSTSCVVCLYLTRNNGARIFRSTKPSRDAACAACRLPLAASNFLFVRTYVVFFLNSVIRHLPQM